MQAEFSEFSYAFALVQELSQVLGNAGMNAVPVFPTQRQEAHLGYDVRLDLPGFPLFLQFKRGDYANSPTAKGVVLGLPVRRFEVYATKKSSQHDLLCDLAVRQPGSVFYVAPCFHTQEELNRYSNQRRITSCSCWLPVESIKPFCDNQKHLIAYNGKHSAGRVVAFSERRDITGIPSFEHLLSRWRQQTRGHVVLGQNVIQASSNFAAVYDFMRSENAQATLPDVVSDDRPEEVDELLDLPRSDVYQMFTQDGEYRSLAHPSSLGEAKRMTNRYSPREQIVGYEHRLLSDVARVARLLFGCATVYVTNSP